MGRKVGLAAGIILIAVLSVVLVGGQIGGGFLWWGNREPIYIYGDDDFTYGNGVMSGSGTATDPYIIEGWRIDAPNAEYGIYIDHTTRHFVIRDCVVERARTAGIYFNTVRNGRIESVQVSLSNNAVYFLNATDNVLAGSVIAKCRLGVVMAAESRDNVIVGNAFIDNGMSGHDPQRRNRWYDEAGGNYWSDYAGVDDNGDGIGDDPYYPLRDSYPLMASPIEWTDVEPAGYTYAGNQVSPDGSLVVTSQTPITLSAVDPGSGLSEIRYSIDGGAWAAYAGPITLTGEDGPRKVTYYGIDNLGNEEAKTTVSFLLDNHPPETAIEIGEPRHVDERGTWITSSSRITLRREEESTHGVTKTFYRIDGGAWQRYSTPFVVFGYDGPHTVTFYSQNASGVTEPLQTVILIKDDAPPHTRGAQASSPAAIEVILGPPTSEAILEPPHVEPASVVVEEMPRAPAAVDEAAEVPASAPAVDVPPMVEEAPSEEAPLEVQTGSGETF